MYFVRNHSHAVGESKLYCCFVWVCLESIALGFAIVKLRILCQPYTAISRKIVGKNVHATIPKVNMGYDQYTVPNDCICQTYFCCFPLTLANICPWPLVPLFQFPLENRADKTTHNTFRDCGVHFFRQSFSKQL